MTKWRLSSQNGGEQHDGRREHRLAGNRRATKVPRVRRTGFASAPPVQTITRFVFLRNAFLISPAVLSRASPVPAPRRVPDRTCVVRARAGPAEAQGCPGRRHAGNAGQRVALYVEFARFVQCFDGFNAGVGVVVGHPIIPASASTPALQSRSGALQLILAFFAKSCVSNASCSIVPRAELQLTCTVTSYAECLSFDALLAEVAVLIDHTSFTN